MRYEHDSERAKDSSVRNEDEESLEKLGLLLALRPIPFQVDEQAQSSGSTG